MKRRVMEVMDGSSHDRAGSIVEWIITFVVLTLAKILITRSERAKGI